MSLPKHLPSTYERVITRMLEKGSINSQEAEKNPIFCRHLNSVISRLRNQYQIDIYDHRETVKGYGGCDTRLKRYYLLTLGAEQAIESLNRWREARGLAPLPPSLSRILIRGFKLRDAA